MRKLFLSGKIKLLRHVVKKERSVMKEKIAVLTDSGSDIKAEAYEKLFVLPLLIHINEKTYIDGVDIDLGQVLYLVDDYKVTTSLPSPESIIETLNKIKSLGYTHVIANTISSGLSGTYNILRLLIEGFDELKIALLDTKNISKGSGFTTLTALELIEEGKSFEEIVPLLEQGLENNKVFFTLKSLEHLRRGGRIGLITKALADLINLKPIISCNEEGVYYTVRKARGYKNAIRRTLELAQEFVGESKVYDLTILVMKMDEMVDVVKLFVSEMFPSARSVNVTLISPALAIHIAPEAFGLAIRKID